MQKIKRLCAVLFAEIRQTFTLPAVLSILLGTAITTFGLYNIHYQADITEGGILGLILLLNHWTGLPSSAASPILDGLCYLLGFRYLGREFLKTSLFATCSMAFFFRIWEAFPPLLPSLASFPLAAAIAGGCFIGTGCGLVVRRGASCAGDDALALVISRLTGWKLSRAYLFTDLTVLLLSLSYIPAARLACSLVTVTVSSLLIDVLQNASQ